MKERVETFECGSTFDRLQDMMNVFLETNHGTAISVSYHYNDRCRVHRCVLLYRSEDE